MDRYDKFAVNTIKGGIMPIKPIISAYNIKKNFGQTHALRGVSLDVNPGEVLAIMGPSGSGKSTLLHSLASIINIDSGEIVFDGKRIDKLNDKDRSILRRTEFGFVFQFGQLVSELSVHDNVALPLLLNGIKRKDAYKAAKSWIHKVGLQGKEDNLPAESLDSLNSEKVMELFIKTAKENGTTVIMVTHEPSIAAYADREIIVRDGQISGKLAPSTKQTHKIGAK